MKTKQAPVIPSWYGNIRHLFNEEDVNHMSPMGIHLNNYDDVKKHATEIYGQVASGNMPPDRPWNSDQKQLFLDWMKNNYPKGEPEKQKSSIFLPQRNTNASRIRKDVRNLSSDEIKVLKKAFTGIMESDNHDDNSYYKIAGVHGLPDAYCLHHIPPYNPWHRAYLLAFENALRSIEGCEKVTLPYWDFYSEFPNVFNEAPFDSYTVKADLGVPYGKNYKTSRYEPSKIVDNFKKNDVIKHFKYSMTQKDWEDFHGGQAFKAPNDTSIQAHDMGHVSTGKTMSDQNVASFDPIFWFYHCNIDRLFWEWQVKMNATDFNGLMSTITTDLSKEYFTISALKVLKPLTNNPPHLNTVKIIDSIKNLDVDYGDPKDNETNEKVMTDFTTKRRGSVAASEKFYIDTTLANVRVKGINRIKIPGSFKVHLLKDGNPIGTRAFFQPNEADKCPNCVENPFVHFDFKLPLDSIKSGKLEALIEPLNHEPFGDRFPHKMMGNPTINVRLLLRNE